MHRVIKGMLSGIFVCFLVCFRSGGRSLLTVHVHHLTVALGDVMRPTNDWYFAIYACCVCTFGEASRHDRLVGDKPIFVRVKGRQKPPVARFELARVPDGAYAQGEYMKRV